MKKISGLFFLGLFFSNLSIAQSFDYPCIQGEVVISNDSPITQTSDSIRIFKYKNLPVLRDSSDFIGNEIEKYKLLLYKLKEEAMKDCEQFGKKEKFCLEDVRKVNQEHAKKVNQVFNKYLRDIVRGKFYFERYVSKKKIFPFRTVAGRRKNRSDYLVNKKVDLPTFWREGYSCLKEKMKFECIVDSICSNESCPNKINDFKTQTCLCVSLCSPDQNCIKYKYDSTTCKRVCIERPCHPQPNCQAPQWNNKTQKCECKKPAIETRKFSNANASAFEANTKANLGDTAKCPLRFQQDGKNIVVSWGMNFNTKTECNSLFSTLDYENGEFEVPSGFARTTMQILDAIKKTLKSEFDISLIRILGAADSTPCNKKYKGNYESIDKYYLLSEDKNCKIKGPVSFTNDNTKINNETLGLLRAYQFKKLIRKNFKDPTIKLYSLPFTHKGGEYRRVEIFVVIYGFNEKFYEETTEEDKKDYLEAYKNCELCNCYGWITNCEEEK